MKKILWLWLLSLYAASSVVAQSPTELKGCIIDNLKRQSVSDAKVTLLINNLTATTDKNGCFVFGDVKSGTDVLKISGTDIVAKEVAITITSNQPLDMGTIKVALKPTYDVSLTGFVDESLLSVDDSEGLSQDVSSMVIFSNDIFLQNAGYQFSQFRFRTRGYESRFEERYINGVSFNDQIRGIFNYSSIGALNDVTRNGTSTNYFDPSTYSFGSIGGSENINMRAGNYARGGKLTLSLTNRNYYSRAMSTYSTGMQDNGWAVTASVGARYSDEGSIEGVFYRNVSYALGVEKRTADDRHSVSFITFGSPVERGQQTASLQEAYDLADNNLYNANWGYQNGEKRNSRIVRAFDPTTVLSHTWKLNDVSSLITGFGAHYSRYGSTALNWYNGPDPRPDYYRYLPSYQSHNETSYVDYYTYLWQSEQISQLDWDGMWEANYLNKLEGNGSAIYMVEERRRDLFEMAFNTTLNTQLSDRVKLTAGLGYKNSLSKQFKTVDDLLGADYALDIDKFAERDTPGNNEIIQNNLMRPDRKVYEKDIFGYDFRFRINSADIWAQQQHSYRHFDVYFGAKLKYTGIQREGLMQNGRYPDSSYGKGKLHTFMDYALKGGLTYNFTGRHFLTANISYQTQAPLVDKMYVSPRVTDNAIDNPKSMEILSFDANYVISLPYFSGRLSVFNTSFHDDMMRISYYHDSERTYVNHVLPGLNKIHRGIELGMNIKLNNNWNFDLIGTTAEYFYSNNPIGTISYENASKEDVQEKVYMENLKVGGVPQTIGTIGINYFYNYWFLNLNINGFARNHVEVSPIRRLASNYIGVTPPVANGYDAGLYEAYMIHTHQERYSGGATVDFGIGKIWYLPNRHSVNFNLTVNNLLNKTDIRTGGYEQGRINLEYATRFTSKYYYMQGINAFLNVSYRY